MKKMMVMLFTFYLLLHSLFTNAVSRHALVIGNGAYNDVPLANPVNDASDISEALRLLGFEVEQITNIDRKTMRKAIRGFSQKLKKEKGVAFFYYAGHGVQVEGENFLLPINSEIESEDDVFDEAVAAQYVLDQMEAANDGVNVVVLDACRNNPFQRSFRSRTRGLSRMSSPKGSFVAFSTSPGSVAMDGEERNGVYTSYFLKYLTQPGLTIERLFKKVRVAVENETKGKQIPWESSSLKGDFYFVGNSRTDSQQERLMWESVQYSPYVEELQWFVDTFPNSAYAVAAKIRINQIQSESNNLLFGVANTEKRIRELFDEIQVLLLESVRSPESVSKAYALYQQAKLISPESKKIAQMESYLIDGLVALVAETFDKEDYEVTVALNDAGLALAPDNVIFTEMKVRLYKALERKPIGLPGI